MSHFERTTSVEQPAVRATSATARSCSTTPSLESTRTSATSARSAARDRPELRVVLDALPLPALSAHAGGVDEHERRLAALEHRVDAVARRPGLARRRSRAPRRRARSGGSTCPRSGAREWRRGSRPPRPPPALRPGAPRRSVEQVAGAVAVHAPRSATGSPRPSRWNSSAAASRCGSSILFATTTTGLRARRRISAISSSPGVDSGARVHDEEDEVGLLDRTLRLLRDVARERRRVGHVDAARVDEDEALPRPLADDLLAVARHARRLEDDRLAGRGQPVDERGLADVREADDRDRPQEGSRSSGFGGDRRAVRRNRVRPTELVHLDEERARGAGSRPGSPRSPACSRARSAGCSSKRIGSPKATDTGARFHFQYCEPWIAAGTTGTPSWIATMAAPDLASPGTPAFCRVPSTKRPSRSFVAHGLAHAGAARRGRTPRGGRRARRARA